MPIKVSCSCGQAFKAKDELAGKRVRCPKCQNPLTIPNAPAAPAPAPAPPSNFDDFALAPAADVPKYNPLEDILQDEGVKSAVAGPTCPNCGEGITPSAVLCVQCGFNLTTGEKINTSFSYDEDDEDALATAGMSETDKMLYKAEKELEGTPISAEGEKFGDEGDSYLVAMGAIIGTVLLVGLGVGTILVMDSIPDFNSFRVSLIVACVGYTACWGACTILAFRESPLHGLLCVVTSAQYGIYYYVWTRGYYILGIVWVVFGLIAGILLGIATSSMQP